MKFSELRECPFCGNDEYFTRDRYLGSSRCNHAFDPESKKEVYNGQMYDDLIHVDGKLAFCNNCFKYLGHVENDKISKEAEQALAQRGAKDE